MCCESHYNIIIVHLEFTLNPLYDIDRNSAYSAADTDVYGSRVFVYILLVAQWCFTDYLVGIGPNLSTDNLIQSIAAALHLGNQPVVGQSQSTAKFMKNPTVHINTNQPLIQVCAG